MTAKIGLLPTGDGIEVRLSCDHGAWSRQLDGSAWNSRKSQQFAMRSLVKERLAEQPCPCLERLAAEV